MNEGLTGRAAVDAIGFYMGAAAVDAGFDARKVARDLQNWRGRIKLRLAFFVTVTRARVRRVPAARKRVSRAPRRARGRAAPGRPAGRP